MKKVILFDLGNTLIRNVSFDIKKGFSSIYDNLNLSYSKEEFLKIAIEKFNKTYSKRDDEEIPFKVFLKENLNLDENLESVFYVNSTMDDTIEDAFLFVELLKENKLVYIITNSMFSKETLIKTKIIKDLYDIVDGFYSSADLFYRKPSKILFEKLSLNYEKNEMIMIGNDLDVDLKFSNNNGIDFLFFNENDIVYHNDYFCSYRDLIKKWGEKFD